MLPARLPACRERGQRVNALLKAGKPSEALELLAEDPKLAWVKDAESGGGCGRLMTTGSWGCRHRMPPCSLVDGVPQSRWANQS